LHEKEGSTGKGEAGNASRKETYHSRPVSSRRKKREKILTGPIHCFERGESGTGKNLSIRCTESKSSSKNVGGSRYYQGTSSEENPIIDFLDFTERGEPNRSKKTCIAPFLRV